MRTKAKPSCDVNKLNNRKEEIKTIFSAGTASLS